MNRFTLKNDICLRELYVTACENLQKLLLLEVGSITRFGSRFGAVPNFSEPSRNSGSWFSRLGFL
jgi:hypothetical protein